MVMGEVGYYYCPRLLLLQQGEGAGGRTVAAHFVFSFSSNYLSSHYSDWELNWKYTSQQEASQYYYMYREGSNSKGSDQTKQSVHPREYTKEGGRRINLRLCRL